MVQVAVSRVALLLVLVGCTRQVPLATLEGRALTEREFQHHLDNLYPADEREKIRESPARRQAELNQWLDGVAIAAKARRLGLDREPRFRKAVELMEMRTLARLLTEQNRARIEAITRVSQDEVPRFYEEHKGEYLAPPTFTARQILVYVRGNPAFPERGLGESEARAKARRALRQLRRGQSWEVVARRFSDDHSNNQRGGLIRDGRFGLFPSEVEQAVRTQEMGKPGDLVKSLFGFHVLQVESRSLEASIMPLAQVESAIRERLALVHAEQAHRVFVEPMAVAMGLKVTEAGKRDASLLDESLGHEIVAEVAGKAIRQSDFLWFLKDAFPAPQRILALSRPGARRKLFESFLDELTLEAKARRDGLDSNPAFVRERTSMVQSLLIEFLQEHDKSGPFCQCQETPDEQQAAQRRYFDRVRTEVGLRPTFSPVRPRESSPDR